MKFVKIVHCQRDLDFTPETPWPQALPPISWKNWLLSGFNSEMDKALQLTESHFHRAFQSCYRHLSLPELARFYLKARRCSTITINWTEFLKSYSFRDCENTRLILEPLAQTPMEFQRWCFQKQLAPKDLAILRSLQSVQPITSLFSCIARLNPSKSLGIQILCLACELYLMGYRTETLVKESTSSQHWYEFLKSHRYPNAVLQDQSLALKLKKLPWPSGSHVRGVRFGDLSGFEVRFQVHSQRDFRKYLQGLQHTCECIETEPDSLW